MYALCENLCMNFSRMYPFSLVRSAVLNMTTLMQCPPQLSQIWDQLRYNSEKPAKASWCLCSAHVHACTETRRCRRKLCMVCSIKTAAEGHYRAVFGHECGPLWLRPSRKVLLPTSTSSRAHGYPPGDAGQAPQRERRWKKPVTRSRRALAHSHGPSGQPPA